MIDVENAIFDFVAKRVREAFARENILVSSEYTEFPARFPAATIWEADNSVYEKMRTTRIENAVKLLYEANVYSNKTVYRKTEAQNIMNVIDGAFTELGFTRTLCQPVSNLMDEKIYRMLARYEAVVDRDHWVYTH